MSDSWASTLLASACSGMIGKVVFHPLDTIKARLQASAGIVSYKNTFNAFRTIIGEEGIRGLYKGLSVMICGGTPGMILFLTGYEKSKEFLSTVPVISSSPFMVYLTSGMIAEAICGVIFVPVDVLKNRMQLQLGTSTSLIAYPGQPIYYNWRDALQKTVHLEGIRGLYKGYMSSLYSYGPFSALYFLCYEELKRELSKVSSIHQDAFPFHYSLLCSVAASSVSAYVTSPLDLIRFRIQVYSATESQQFLKASSASSVTYIIHFLSQIYKTNGFRGLYCGAVTRVLFFAPSTALTIALFDHFKIWWNKVLSN